MDSRKILQETTTQVLDTTQKVVNKENLGSFWDGFSSCAAGANYLRKTPALWIAAIPCAIFSLAVSILALAILIATIWFWWTSVYPWMVQGQVDTMLWVWRAVAVSVGLLMVIVAIVFDIVMWQLASITIASSLHSRLATVTEEQLGISEDEINSIAFADDLKDTSMDIAVWLTNIGGVALVCLVPLVGPPVAGYWMWYSSCFNEGLGFWSYPLGVRGVRRKERIQFARDHRAATLGMGSVVMVGQFTPLVSAIVIPSSVVGSVVLYRKMTTDIVVPHAQSPA